MKDLIARALHALCALLFPATGSRRAGVPPTAPPATLRPAARSPLPPRKSPYAIDAAANVPFVDTLDLVRPYLDAAPRKRPMTPEQQAQAERLWALDMADRGIDVGPYFIHGVYVSPHGRTVPVNVAVAV
ncbi:hypothetical protein [Streptomyces sp. N50]|uniref:hypothetical protein n=1 Tax=Streptomyces sp. N50 TaxID=3081765 RepID=UPI0029622BF3|nr:hypothetical protein [Streptomyces sp. N50]WOX11065.1 hypothetical protein R2B38_20555 [Streptomyces sp. N50]